MRLILAAFAAAATALATADAGYRAAAQYNAAAGGVSLVALKGGAVDFEDYPNGGARDAAWNLASGTKSFSCAIAAAAVKDGLLDLDEQAAGTLGEWRPDPRKSLITIRQILNLTSGVRPAPIGRAPTYAAAIAEPASAAPGTEFAYGPVNFQIFGEIMRRKLAAFENGEYPDALAYLQDRIFDPLGIAPAAWKRGADGYPTLPQGAEFSARDWARYGEFVLANGRWDGRALVDEPAFASCFKGSAINSAYGLTFWLNAEPSAETLAASRTMTVASDLYTHPRRNELPGDLVMAAGAGGQRMYVIPSLELVVVRQYPRLFERRLGRRGGEKFSDVEFLLRLLAP
jgi:CubicO group peptidase (beta-lactamase class C family)